MTHSIEETITGVDLSSLNAFVDFTLSATEKVRRILQTECDGAKFVLRPWVIETVVTRDVDKAHCICESTDNQQAEELAAGIDKALAQAQELRQKLSHKIQNKHRYQSKTLQDIYAPRLVSSSTTITAKRRVSGDRKKNISAENKSSLGNITKTAANSKSTKNFIAANKSNVRAISRKNIEFTKNQTAQAKDLSLKSSNPSISELDNLIKKISLDIVKKQSSPRELENDCPRHGINNDITTVTERKRTTIDLIEGLDQFGISNDLLKILRLYHSHVNSSMNGEHERDRRAGHKFLNNMKILNEMRLEKLESDDMRGLVQGFPELYRNLISTTGDPVEICKIKKKYGQLDALSKRCKIKKYDLLKVRKSIVNPENHCTIGRGWLSNGIWNWTNLQYFSELNRVSCIRYASGDELLSLFDTCQRLQLSLYRHNLLDLLLKNVIPRIRETTQPTSEEYVKLYKMIFTVAQVLNLRLPVLVKTEK